MKYNYQFTIERGSVTVIAEHNATGKRCEVGSIPIADYKEHEQGDYEKSQKKLHKMFGSYAKRNIM